MSIKGKLTSVIRAEGAWLKPGPASDLAEATSLRDWLVEKVAPSFLAHVRKLRAATSGDTSHGIMGSASMAATGFAAILAKRQGLTLETHLKFVACAFEALDGVVVEDTVLEAAQSVQPAAPVMFDGNGLLREWLLSNRVQPIAADLRPSTDGVGVRCANLMLEFSDGTTIGLALPAPVARELATLIVEICDGKHGKGFDLAKATREAGHH